MPCSLQLVSLTLLTLENITLMQSQPSLEAERWYVVYSKPHKEEVAQFHLQQKGLEVFLPKLLLPPSSRKRRCVVPLFPNYLFTRLRSFQEYHYALWSPGVKHFVSFNGVPAPLEDDIVEFLMRQSAPGGFIKAHSSLQAGQEIQIIGGPFEGLLGIILEPPKAKERVKVLLQLLSRQIKVELPLHFVKSEWVLNPSVLDCVSLV